MQEKAVDSKVKTLLHVCCAPCSSYVVQELAKKYDITLYFYNPNIHPEDEYNRRLAEIRKWAEAESLKLIEGEYDVDSWREITKGQESEPERGSRCHSCFELRLANAASTAANLGYKIYGTVLTVSPHKDAVIINKVGVANGRLFGVDFEQADWKKKDGYKKSVVLSKAKKFYRQDYCGCIYSLKAKNSRDNLKSNRAISAPGN